MIVFSLNDPEMESAIRKWLNFIAVRHGRPLLSVILVGTHFDLEVEVFFSFLSSLFNSLFNHFSCLIVFPPPDRHEKRCWLGRNIQETLQRFSMHQRKSILLC